VGAVAARGASRQANRQQQAAQQQSAQQQQQAAQQQQSQKQATYGKARAACLEGRGYSVK
jgi:hypothetical protein